MAESEQDAPKPARKAAAKKTAAKGTASRKPATKPATAKKSATKKAAPKKATARKATATKPKAEKTAKPAARKPAEKVARDRTDKTAEVQTPEKPHYQFKSGQSGNPKGRPKGSRNKITRQIMDLFDENGEQVAAALVARANKGHVEAARIVLDRIAPVPKTPKIDPEALGKIDPGNMVAAHDQIIRALIDGNLDAEQAGAVTAQLEARRKTIEMTELRSEVAEMKELLQKHEERFASHG